MAGGNGVLISHANARDIGLRRAKDFSRSGQKALVTDGLRIHPDEIQIVQSIQKQRTHWVHLAPHLDPVPIIIGWVRSADATRLFVNHNARMDVIPPLWQDGVSPHLLYASTSGATSILTRSISTASFINVLIDGEYESVCTDWEIFPKFTEDIPIIMGKIG
ncbi:hypothetical protein K493DRAFT_307205 [Basidiobolus meristosporus CBS 931.73]|uniref:Uncharacterized protein n=1 Tax=Basidiobolus meristosporus CBS 931.73 TaxID=1314790 RepID=A0A1Y1XK23_9FUNG|nr:hypothetical protein K493DRAFT_307205 [Basidiobolus meristosporus CBS 931.73]|eukprot:ORX85694.1 hypothetical protein K493DRAFT_307205 [Basidiobolus meristosporus CBS 931.73]